MVVLKLVRADTADTVAVLRCLLADAEKGLITGLALCYRTRDGEQAPLLTGAYKAHPGKAVAATMKLSWRLTQEQDRLLAPP